MSMYVTTIAKIYETTNVWAGFNMLSTPLLEGDLIKECASYDTEFEPCEKGELKVIESNWNGYRVIIQYRRIN